MSADAAGFYDDLADDYHLIFVDWDRTIAYQAGVLVPLLRRLGVPDGARVLDASCGIGTQALGLAAAGYAVTGTDLSPGAIDRARTEAAARGLDATFAVADLRRLADDVDGRFDCVLSCDNSLAHMLEDAELRSGGGRSCGLHRARRRRLRQHPAATTSWPRSARRPRSRASAGRTTRGPRRSRSGTGTRQGGRTGWSSSCCARGRAARGGRAPT